MGGVATGQDDRGLGSEPAAETKADGVEGSDAALRTLEELKAAGALRSSYRKHQPRSVGSETPKPSLAAFRKDVEPVLKKSCVECHGPETQEGNIRIDTLDPDLLHGDDVNWWLEVVAVLSNSEMPPEDADELADEDRSKVVEWLSSELQVASAVRRAEQGHSSFRRMTRYEYNYALQDLLGLPNDFAGDLPPEPASEDGFQNSSEMLQMSAIQFGYYRELSRNALKKATVSGDRPELLHYLITMDAFAERAGTKVAADIEKKRKQFKNDPARLKRELELQAARRLKRPNGTHFRDLNTGEMIQDSWSYRGAKHAWEPANTRPELPAVSHHVAVIPAKQKLIIELGNTVPDTGTLRVRIRASAISVDKNRVPSLRLEFGWQASNNSSASVRISDHDVVVDAAPDKPQLYQWDIPLSEIYPRNPMRKTAQMGSTPSPSEFVKLENSSLSPADIQIDYVEVTVPVYDQWPPQSHTRLFIDSPNKSDETEYAREILTDFMSRAWRRSVTASEVDQKLSLFARIRPVSNDFQEAMIEVLATALSSPKFLYLVQADSGNESEDGKPGRDDGPILRSLGPSSRANTTQHSPITEFELATRLSMFLWCSTPDEELLELAASEKLRDSSVLISQTKRMLADSRAQRFSRHFVRQWLGMELLDFLNVDKKAYPQFDVSLKEAMQEEPIALFHEVLQNNRSVMDFIHSDYTMANERLARHYGLENVYGNHFRKVPLSLNNGRGGLLTQAGLLAMNSDGKDSHPLKRGIWMLESLLNDPPPPPPPAVPEIDLADPEIAKLTLKQRIENHRNHPACMSCHSKIDPWGIAFENYDAIGSWRTEIKGQPVDASSRLFNRQTLDGMDGLKRYLLSNRQDQFARAMVYKLATFALGRPLTFGDRSSVDQITADLREQGDGLATLVTLIVTSDLFGSN